MAVHSQHPASAPPTAPAREKTGHLLLRAWCVFVVVFALTGVAWVYAVGPVVTGILVGAATVVSAVVWAGIRPPYHWRRLPWFVLAYALWALVSLTWSAWPAMSAVTWLLLAATTLQGLFVGAVLTWRELVAALASALKWTVGLALLFDVAVATLVRGPLLPGFVVPAAGDDSAAPWSRGDFWDAGARTAGFFGDPNLLALVCVVAVLVFAIRIAAGAPRRWMLIVWIVVAAVQLVRAASATAVLSILAAGVVLATVLLMRRAVRPRARTKYYLAYAAVAVGAAVVLWVWRGAIFEAVGRSDDLLVREEVWAAVGERIAARPVIGWGFATPWLPAEPHIGGWIEIDGRTVLQAHSIWVDAGFQLGAVGVLLLGLLWLAFVWRAWFFGVDRPRWDLRADRPYSPLTLLPTLLATVLLAQGLAESAPLFGWGWMLVVALAGKIKQSPLVGVGPTEATLAIERGDHVPGR